jgi:hypothetical protein
MIKALLFVKKGNIEQEYEVTTASELQLIAFLNRLADETGAPRPHRVFLSPRVNACVFYDLSLLNFIFPSKKILKSVCRWALRLIVWPLRATMGLWPSHQSWDYSLSKHKKRMIKPLFRSRFIHLKNPANLIIAANEALTK